MFEQLLQEVGQQAEKRRQNRLYECFWDIAFRPARGMERIEPHRSGRQPENRTQDGRTLRRYRRRWVVERTVAWLRHFRRLCIRPEKLSRAFDTYLRMACAFLLVRQVLG